MSKQDSSEAPDWLDLSRFELVDDYGRAAILRLEGDLRRRRRPPKNFLLLARRGTTVTTHSAVANTLDRQSSARSSRLRWSVCFALPPAIVDDPRVSFELVSAQLCPVSLPELGWSRAQAAPLIELRAPRVGIAALASAAAFLGSLGAAPALADGTVTATTATTATTAITATTPTTTTATPETSTTSTTTTSTTTQTTTPTTTQTTPSTTKTSTGSSHKTKKHPSGTGGGGSTDASKPQPKAHKPKHHSRHHSQTCLSDHGHSTATKHSSVKGSSNKCGAKHHKGKHAHHSTGAAGLHAKKHHHKAKPHSTSTGAPIVSTAGSPWSSPLMADPFTAAQLRHYAALVAGLNKPPKYLVRIYRAAARHYHIPWQVLAAINYVETGYGRDLALSSAGAEGWMQFMPSTWAEYGVSVTTKGKPQAGLPNPWDPADAIFAAAHYLKAAGAQHNMPKAVFAYNHAGWYVQEVLSIAQAINRHGMRPQVYAHRKLAAMLTTARLLNGLPYVWGGGHANFSMVTPGYDCSGFVSAVLHAGGYLKVPVTTQSLPGQPLMKLGKGRFVSIYDRTDTGIHQDHVIIKIGKQWWESGGWGVFSDRVHRMRHVNKDYLQSFNLILHPRGL